MSLRNLFFLLFAAGAAHAGIDRIENRAGQPVAVAGDVLDLVGSDLGAQTAAITDWPIPTTLAGVQVLCDNYPAPVLSVAPDRIRIQLPWELAGLTATQVRIIRGDVKTGPTPVPLTAVAPAIIGASAESVAPGQTLTLRVIGLGPRDRNPAGGASPSSSAPGSSFVRPLVLIGSAPAPVTADALAPGDPLAGAGVQNIAVQIPYNVESGAISVLVRIGSAESAPFPFSVQSTDVRVSISPASIQTALNGGQKLTATVQGTPDQSLQWSIDPAGTTGTYASIENGQLSVRGLMPSPPWLVVRAKHASGAFATALVEIVAQERKAYRIVPEFPVIAPGESVSFSLLDPDGAIVSGVSWSFSDGVSSGNSGNVYTAPTTYPPPQARASARVPGQYGYLNEVASTTVIIAPPRLLVTGVTPAVAHIGEPITFQGIGTTGRVAAAWFTTADGSRVRGAGENPVTVPHGAVSGPAFVEMKAAAGGPTFLSAPYHVTVLPRLRLHAARQRVASGESVQIVAAAPDAPITHALTWRADLGAVDANGVFTAPSVTAPAFARIWACQLQNSECGTVVVQVLPLRLDPDPLVLNPGETVQLRAVRGGAEVTATWQALTANVTVTPAGTLTVGTGLFDGGSAIISAAAAGVSQRFEISIRAAGTVAHTMEYYDWLGYDNNSPNGRLALGVFSKRVAVKGQWIYAVSQSLQYYGGAWQTTWLDVYKLDDRKNPVWVDSLEAPYNATAVEVAGDTLYVAGKDGDNLVLRYDIANGRPVLRSRGAFEGDASSYRAQGLRLAVTSYYETPGPITFEVRDQATGQTRKLTTDYTPFTRYSASGAAAENWAAVMIAYPFASGANYETVVFDTSGPGAVTIAVLPAGGFNGGPMIMQDLLVVGRDVYRVSGSEVTLQAQLPGEAIIDHDAATKRLLLSPVFTIQDDGYRVADLSDAAHPKISAAIVHPDQSTTGKLGDDYFVLLKGGQNLSVYPILWQPGIRKIDSFPGTPWTNAVRARGGYLYWAGPGWGYKGRSQSMGIFEVDDISTVPSRVVAAMDRPGDQVAWAIELNGSYAYVGTDTELIVYDISSPAAPVQTTVLPAPAISFALLGNYLYAGSNTGTVKTLLVYDVADPGRPKLVTALPLADWAYGLAAQPGWLAVALGKSGFTVYSLVNPAAPALASQSGGTVWDVAGDRNLLHAAGDQNGLLIYDVTNAGVPRLLSITGLAVGTEQPGVGGYPSALSVTLDARGIAWLASGKEGRVYGIDVRNPATPRHVAEVMTGTGVAISEAAGAVVANNHLYVAGNAADFEIAVPQNVGLYGFAQPAAGQIRPDRYNDEPPVARQSPAAAAEPMMSEALHGRESAGTADRHAEPMKSRVLNGREPPEKPEAPARGSRPFRQAKPPHHPR